MRSVRKTTRDTKSQETLEAILACLQVQTKAQYNSLCKRFAAETDSVQMQELVEVESHLLRADTGFIHDRFSMWNECIRLRPEAFFR